MKAKEPLEGNANVQEMSLLKKNNGFQTKFDNGKKILCHEEILSKTVEILIVLVRSEMFDGIRSRFPITE